MESDADLLEKLRQFLELHTKSRILNAEKATMAMYIKACHTNQNKKPKDQTINFLLLRFKEQLIDENPDPASDRHIIARFLLKEMNKFYK